jgi:N-acetylglucosaminyl-diphospho-decaprenol L-rhamnosyltransferase
MNELAILIVSHNAAADLERCLDSLLHAPPRVSHELVVIDNASRDGSVQAVKARAPRVRLIPLPSNFGFAGGNNAGFRQTQSELVLLLNSDTVVPSGAIDRLVQQLRLLPGASVAGPRLVNARGEAELSFGRMMSPLAELRQKFLTRPGGQARIEEMTSREQEADWVSGACLLVRRADAESAGLLDERYFMYGEDVDFCAAIRARGGRVYFTPSAEVVHLGGRSWGADRQASNTAYARSQLAFYQKHHPAWAPVLRLYLTLKGKLPAKTADKT